VASDQVSYISGWQEGAVRSACHVLKGIAGKDCTLRMVEEGKGPGCCGHGVDPEGAEHSPSDAWVALRLLTTRYP
jgi:hypothetical protein